MDNNRLQGSEFIMRPLLLLSLLVLGPNLFAAQEQSPASQKSGTIKLPAGTLPYDPAVVAAAIRDSYYHPDKMSALECAVSVNWPAFFSAAKLNLSEDRLSAIQGLKIRSRAARDKKPEITFEWSRGTFDNKEQFEDGLNQIVGGFYQMYWSMIAVSPISSASDITKIEPRPDGGTEVYSSSQNFKLVTLIDRQNTPTRYTLESPAMNGTMEFRYSSAPKPVPGDLRRISGMDVSERIGTSVINVKLGLDYQLVDGFNVPSHVTYELVGAYSLSMDFSGCSALK
jgi:hypothetical protein